MSELAVASDVVTPSESDLPITADMTLIARSPDQLQVEQRRLIGWCAAKREDVAATIAELETGIAYHRKQKWNCAPLRNALSREKQRRVFYEKVQMALEAGFYIVPNFPCDVFAVRTSRRAMGLGQGTSRWQADGNAPAQQSEALPIGDGAYQNPNPVIQRSTGTEDGKTTYFAEVVGYDGMEFPFTFAKPEVLSATADALSLKLFDELGVLPGRKKKADPMVIGRIVRPWQRKRWNSEQNQQRHLSFLVVWWLDTNTI